jgi:DDE superfamily endonuclease
VGEETVVHPRGGSGVCVAHGGCAGALRGALRSQKTHSVLRRVALPDGVAEKRTPLPQKPGRPQRYDYEYERKGTVNIFAFFEPKRGWRHLDITERRTAVDFALAMRRLVDEHYTEAEKVRVILDNLNTHTGAALYQAFEPEEARRLLPLTPVGVSLHAQARLLAEHGGG